MRFVIFVLLGLILIDAATSSYVAVDATEFAYITQFGKPVAVYDGGTEAGFHWKLPWPIQSAIRLDRRLQIFDLPSPELLTHDATGQTIDRTLTVSAYVCWRIAGPDGADRFFRTVGKAEQAEAILGPQISSRIGALISGMNLDDLISIVPIQEAEARTNRLSRAIMEGGEAGRINSAGGLKNHLNDTYGIDLVDVRIRRLGYPPQVREAIFDRIRSERNKKVAQYQSEGAKLAEDIRTQSEYQARNLLAGARANERRIKGTADAQADRIRNEAQAKDPTFYAFLKKLEEYSNILGDNKTLLLLSSQRELFDLLLKPPAVAPTKPAPASASGNSTKDGR
jgi:modulator of FtsH protease HflC